MIKALSILVSLFMLGGCTMKGDTDVIKPSSGDIYSGDMSYEISSSYESDFDFMKYMPKDQNYMISPFSIKMAMMMAANGANGYTQKEILSALGVSSIDEYNQKANDIITKYNSNKDVNLNVANSIWLNKTEAMGANFKDTYKKIISDFYKGVAMEENADIIASKINDFIAKETNNKITNVLPVERPAGFLSALVNTIYFKGSFENQFDTANTKKDTFTDRNGNKSEIDFMNQTKHFGYYENDGVQMLKMNYSGRDIAMYILLNDDDKDVDINDIISKMEYKKVSVSMPKFKTEFTKSFVDVLKQMGINIAFTNAADFSNMFDNVEAHISDVIHKTFIEVDENGTEAAAATVILMTKNSLPMPEEIKEFKANKPFTYFIRDEVSGEILFLGEYAFAK